MALEEVLERVRVQLEEKIKRQLSGMQCLLARRLCNSRMILYLEMSADHEAFEVMILNEDGIQIRRSH
jgi:hypothetical protein